jgi:glycosyltransferase domain-containing protein
MRDHPSAPNLTLAILSCNRQGSLLRQLELYANFLCNVLIVDGSKVPLAANIVAQIKSEYKFSLKYIYCQADYASRLEIACRNVITEFCISVPDDEFMCPYALSEAVRFLSLHPSYVACGGRSIGFVLKGRDQVEFYDHYPLLEHYRNERPYAPKDLDLDYALHYEIRSYYSVTRSQAWKAVRHAAFNLGIEFYNSSEYTVELLTQLAGKVKTLQTVFWFRNLNEHTPSWWTTKQPETHFHELPLHHVTDYSLTRYAKDLSSAARKISPLFPGGLDPKDESFILMILQVLQLKRARQASGPNEPYCHMKRFILKALSLTLPPLYSLVTFKRHTAKVAFGSASLRIFTKRLESLSVGYCLATFVNVDALLTGRRACIRCDEN